MGENWRRKITQKNESEVKGEMWEMGEGWKETEQKREEEKEVRGLIVCFKSDNHILQAVKNLIKYIIHI